MNNVELDYQLLKIIECCPKNFIKIIKSKKYAYLYDYIMQCTSMLVDNENIAYSLKTRLFWIVNNIKDWNASKVRCQVCGKPMMHCNVKKLCEGYKKTCSKECERKLAQKHSEENLMKKHGVKNSFQLKEVIDKLNAHKDEIQRRREQTKQKNKTFKTSKKEDEAHQILCNVFSSDDVIRQFKDNARYPFCCDFYVKSHNLFIECNFSWTHGGHWFDENNPDDLARLAQMKSKHTKYYDNAIETWTVRDVAKRRCAEANHLNYIVFWTLDEMKKHYSIA